ncbi:Cytosolic endo-beta-N-acetylglucosaminidase 1 [Ancistrocladus abbreviatus]
MQCIPVRAYIGSESLIFFRNSILSIFTEFFHLLTSAMADNDRSSDSPLTTSQSLEHSKQFDPLVPSTPISYPIKTLEELESRSYFDSFHYPFNISSVPLPNYSGDSVLPNRPRLLVCHDMKGGYVDDKWVQGGENPEAYAIWHWYLIDVFVYFSHNLVTLPPPCWTNAAHKHGVKVLGLSLLKG